MNRLKETMNNVGRKTETLRKNLKKHQENNTVKEIQSLTNVELVELRTISNLTEAERKNKDDYFTLMNYNIELLKQELYD